MATMIMQYPDEIEKLISRTPKEFEAQIRFMAAVKMYELGKLSFEKASELAGLELTEFYELCEKYHVAMFNYAKEEIEAEITSDFQVAQKSVK